MGLDGLVFARQDLFVLTGSFPVFGLMPGGGRGQLDFTFSLDLALAIRRSSGAWVFGRNLDMDAGFLGQVTVNGQSYHMGRVRFSSPTGFRHLLNPFARLEDSSGRRFHARSWSDKARVIAAVKKGHALDVLCRPKADGFELVQVGLDWLV